MESNNYKGEMPNMNMNMEKSSLTNRVNDFMEENEGVELTKTIVNEWLNTFPEEDRDLAKQELELGLSEDLDNLPE